MRFRHIIILAAAVILLSSCGSLTVQTAGTQTPAQTTEAPTEKKTPTPAVSEPTPITTADEPTPAPPPTAKPPDIGNDYYIIVDKEDHAFGIFECGEDGKPGLLVETFPCALGKSRRMTPTGTYKTGKKILWKRWTGYSPDRYSPYATYYTYSKSSYHGGLYFHGPMYSSKKFDKLIAKTYEEIGKNKTSGCVRTTTGGAYWVYTYCKAGTVVEIAESSDLVSWPGLKAIDPNFPRWDPTNPDKPEAPEPSASAEPSEEPTPSPSP